MNELDERQFFTLSQLTEQIEGIVVEQFPEAIWVLAEIASFRVHIASGHAYMELVEKGEGGGSEKARLAAQIWRNRYTMLKAYFESSTRTTLREGLRVLLKVRVVYHSVYGLSLNVLDIDPSFTLGELAIAREETLTRLRAEGVMELNRELPFPDLPRRIAVISARGAAGYEDFSEHISKAKRHFGLDVGFFEATMQGTGASASIINALDRIYSELGLWDVVVIIRGGGAQLDLQCYDDYTLAAHVAQFPLPVISGIGHTRDVSVVDLVSHFSFKTPTAVAEFLAEIFWEGERVLNSLIHTFGVHLNQIVNDFSIKLGIQGSKLGFLAKSHTSRAEHALRSFAPQFIGALRAHYFRLEGKHAELATRLQAANPAHILNSGYGILFGTIGRLRSVTDVSVGDSLSVILGDGKLLVRVEKIETAMGQGHNPNHPTDGI